MIQIRLFLVCLILVASFADGAKDERTKEQIEADNTRPASEEHVTTDSEGNKIVNAKIVGADGQEYHFTAPYYDSNEKPLPMEMKLFANSVISDVIEPGKAIIDGALVKNKGLGGMIWTASTYGFKFVKMSYTFRNRSGQLKKKYNRANDATFQKKALGLLPSLVNRAEEELKNEGSSSDAIDYKNKERRLQIAKRIGLIFDGIKQLVHNSPVGTHLDYENIKINDSLMTEEAVEFLKYMKKSGLSMVISAINDKCHAMAEDV